MNKWTKPGDSDAPQNFAMLAVAAGAILLWCLYLWSNHAIL